MAGSSGWRVEFRFMWLIIRLCHVAGREKIVVHRKQVNRSEIQSLFRKDDIELQENTL